MALGVILTFFAGGALLWEARHSGPIGDSLANHAANQPATDSYTLEGMVERPDILTPADDYMQFVMRVDSVVRGAHALPIQGGVLVRWSDPRFPLYSGDRVRVAGPLELDIARINPGTGSPEDYYRRRDVHSAIRLYGDAVERLENGSALSPAHWMSRMRTDLATRLTRVVPETSRPFMLTVWLGDRHRITDETYTTFLESGTAHILAVSGVHVGIIFVTVSSMLRLVVPSRRVRMWIIMAVVLLFALMAGARVSSMRAAIMIVLYLLSDFFDRERDAPTALSLAAILFTLHDPDSVLDIGYQLSFLSISSILIFRDPIGAHLTWIPARIRGGTAVALSVQLLSLPIAILQFHVIATAAVLANLVVIPLLTVVLWLCFLTSIAAYVLPPAAMLFANAMHPFITLIHGISSSIASADSAYRYVSAPTLPAIVAYATATIFLYGVLTAEAHRARWAAGLATALIMTVALWRPIAQDAEVTFLDVGHGDATFIRTPGGDTLLIDAGDRSGFNDLGKRVVGPYLWANHVSAIDALLISHPDRDHIGGATYLLDHFPVGVVYLGPLESDAPEEVALLDQCARLDIPVKRLARGDAIHLRGAELEVLHPPRDWPSSLDRNEASLTTRLSWPGMSVLLPGDAEARAESELAQRDMQSSIVKVPHHGSATSSSAPFIQAADPDLAVISVGRRGRRSVLRPEVVQRYLDAGAIVLRTDRLGGIRLETNNGRVTVRSAREERGYPIRAVE